MLRRLARWSGLTQQIHDLARREIRDATKPLLRETKQLGHQIAALRSEVEALAARLARVEHRAARDRHTARLNAANAELLARLDTVLDEERIAAHVRRAIAAAPLETDPYPHIVVDGVFPTDVYKALLKAIPPAPFFSERDPIKQNIRIPLSEGPELSKQILGFLEEVVAKRVIRPAVLERFHEPLQHHYDAIFGPPYRQRANDMPQAVSGGRLMLRRPGYHLSPHRDPKRSMLTCLLYLAKTGDSEAHGTQIFRVLEDGEAAFRHTYYPEEDGRACELVKVVPYRPNTMLVFLNSSGAHGATIPADAPADLERYAYQFYVGPEGAALEALVGELPDERRARWRSRKVSG